MKIKAAELAGLILMITQFALEFGAKGAIRIVNGWLDSGGGVTAEDFRRLREEHNPPEKYLTEAQRQVLGLPAPGEYTDE